ncbi:TldD/PmbA family protein [candidate division WOR-3 bacterium]|uniref:TldD/PmbA family protein n=1 Tax=candidate division WOR-3 bacterium TaxID=2052148 RepID=A0A937XFD2_UNCW3|nr:TldD/PmbA family protein [candidate division WOR-3 bacterium]
MSHNLPPALETLRGFLPELVAEAETKAPYATALVTQSAGETVAKSPADERTNPVPPRPGIRISVWDGATFHSVATSRVDDRDYLLRLTRGLAESIRVKQGPMPDPGAQLDRHFRSEFQQDPEQVTASQRQEICRHAFEQLARFDKRIVAPRAVYVYEREYRLFCNRSRLLSSDVSNVGFYLVPLASDGKKQVMNFKGSVAPGHEAACITDEVIRETAELAVQYLSAEKVPPGEYRVILDPDITGTLAHESFGHGCEMDALMRGTARAALYVGRRVGSDLVNIVDFGGLPGRHGSIFFSDDGVLAEEPAVLVKDGILQPTLMTDLYSYLHMRDRLPGLKLSANGRLQDYDHPIYARMTNTYFLPLAQEKGGKTKDELIADSGDAVLIEQLTSGMEDPLGWGVQLQALRGREIKGGKLTGKLYYQVGLTGYVPDVLASIDGITSELDVSSGGSCGKGHKEYVRVSSGGPYIRCRMKLG